MSIHNFSLPVRESLADAKVSERQRSTAVCALRPPNEEIYNKSMIGNAVADDTGLSSFI